MCGCLGLVLLFMVEGWIFGGGTWLIASRVMGEAPGDLNAAVLMAAAGGLLAAVIVGPIAQRKAFRRLEGQVLIYREQVNMAANIGSAWAGGGSLIGAFLGALVWLFRVAG